MEIESIRHKALQRFAESGESRGLAEPERLRRMLSYLDLARDFEEFSVPPNFGFHPLTGNRKGSFAMTVTRNWRLTFKKIDERTIGDLNLEDYH
jgi:toxin HigB-1